MSDSESDEQSSQPRTSPVRANPRPPQFSTNGIVKGELHVDPALAPKPPGRPRASAAKPVAASSAKGKEKLAPPPPPPALPLSPDDSEDDGLYGTPPPAPTPKQAVTQAVRAAEQVRAKVDEALDEGERHEYSEGEVFSIYASGIITGIALAYIGWRGFGLMKALTTAAAAVPK